MRINFLSRLVRKVAFLTLVALALASCKKEEYNVGSLSVKLESSLKSVSLENVTVTLTNTQDKRNYTKMTNQEGKILFKDLILGTYDVLAFKTENEISLSANVSAFEIVKGENSLTLSINSSPSSKQGLVIKEVYYNGSAENSYSVMFKDQFVEIFNNSDSLIYADGLYVANLYGATEETDAADPVSKQFDIKENVYADWIQKIPGSGKEYPIQPRKSLLISLNAINFKADTTITEKNKVLDLSKSDFEYYSYDWLIEKGRKDLYKMFDLDNPDVKNMENIFITGGLEYCLMDMTGTSFVLFKTDENLANKQAVNFKSKGADGKFSDIPLVAIPVSSIIDGVDFLHDETGTPYKRLPESIDSGFKYLVGKEEGTLTGKSMRRKVNEELSKKLKRVILKDNNNSAIDFEVIDTPTPRGFDKLSY